MSSILHKIRLFAPTTSKRIETPIPPIIATVQSATTHDTSLTRMSTTPISMEQPNWLLHLIAEKLYQEQLADCETVRLAASPYWMRIADTEPYDKHAVSRDTDAMQQAWRRREEV